MSLYTALLHLLGMKLIKQDHNMNKLLYVIWGIFILYSCENSKLTENNKYTKYVDPFIGTAEHGHTFPGATLPFGGIQFSPDNPRSAWDWCSGYHYSDSIISSFSLSHLSGTGIGDLQDIRILPTISEYNGKKPESYIIANYAKYKHKNEVAKPGFYSVIFDNGIKTELTATTRVGMARITFPEKKNKNIIIDLTTARNWDKTTESYIEKLDKRTIKGYRLSKGWANDQRVYFTMRFSEDFELYAGTDTLSLTPVGKSLKGEKCYALIKFNTENNIIKLKTSTSSANIEGSVENLRQEVKGMNFDKIKVLANNKWEEELSKIKISEENISKLRTFYTALYHSYIAPFTYSDVSGNFKGADGNNHSTKGYTQYTVFSLWDTFRALHPLLTITQQERVKDMVNSMLSHYSITKLMPVWELCGNETNCMIGYHSISVVTEAFLKGINEIDSVKIYNAVKNTLLSNEKDLNLYRKYGYIPYNLSNESVSKTLELAYNFYAMSVLAKKMNNKYDYEYFGELSKKYINLFDATTGFMRGKSSEGKWKEPFDPLYSKHRDDEYTEGNAWQYSWFVPHDTQGLIKLYRGNKHFTNKLEQLFTIKEKLKGEDASPDISGMIGQYAHGNEPSHHIAYLFNYAGRPDRTQFYVNKILNEMYSDKYDGIAGNEDCGQMSAWYVLSSMGLYPLNPISLKYDLTSPLFKNIEIQLPNNKSFKITSDKKTEKDIYIKTVKLNGEKLNRLWITHNELMEGGLLEFELSDKPV